MSNDQKPAKIIIYSTTWCAFCKAEKDYLTSKNIPFTAKDIEQDDSARDELLKKMDGVFSGVPVTDIGGEMILGFDRPKIDGAITKFGIQPTAG